MLPGWLHWEPSGTSEKNRLTLEVFPESSFSRCHAAWSSSHPCPCGASPAARVAPHFCPQVCLELTGASWDTECQRGSEPCLGSLGRASQVCDDLGQPGAQLAPEARLGGRNSGGETKKSSETLPGSLLPACKTWLGLSCPHPTWI